MFSVNSIVNIFFGLLFWIDKFYNFKKENMFFFNGCNGVILVFFDGKEDFLVIEERVSDKENSIVD